MGDVCAAPAATQVRSPPQQQQQQQQQLLNSARTIKAHSARGAAVELDDGHVASPPHASGALHGAVHEGGNRGQGGREVQGSHHAGPASDVNLLTEFINLQQTDLTEFLSAQQEPPTQAGQVAERAARRRQASHGLLQVSKPAGGVALRLWFRSGNRL
jgi:hypothetical protein